MIRKLPLLVKMLLILLVSIGLGTVLLYLVCLLPAEKMDEHLRESSIVFQEEGSYPNLQSWLGETPAWGSNTLDNFTDAIMLLTSAYDGGEPAMERAMSGYYVLSVDKNPAQSLAAHYDEGEEQYRGSYARYWEGWQLYLRPLLLVMNYRQMRFWNRLLQLAASLLLAVLLYRKRRGGYILPLLFVLAMISMRATASALTYSDIFYLYTLGGCVLLANYGRWRGTEKPLFFFLILGILTGFFDFLTYPLVSCGIPLCLYFCMEDRLELGRSLREFVRLCVCWGLGYGGMWAGKWVAASLLTGGNVLADALYAAQVRSSSAVDGEAVRLSSVFSRNLRPLLQGPWFLLFWVCCILLLALIIRRDRLDRLREGLVFLPIACLPLAWYVALSNHSYIHSWFTYRELLIAVFALLCWLLRAAGLEHPAKGGRT